MMNSGIYHTLSRFGPLRRSFAAKIMIVAFLGTHIPLLALIAYMITRGNTTNLEGEAIFLLSLSATLLGTAATLLALWGLLKPISLIGRALADFSTSRLVPELPLSYPDQVGTLMANTQMSIERLNRMITSLEDTDEETGLLNRQALLREQFPSGAIAVIETLNHDLIGAGFGRPFLQYATHELVERLRLASGAESKLFRLSPNQFAAHCVRWNSEELIREDLDRILNSLRENIAVQSHAIQFDFRAGFSLIDLETPAALALTRAESACSLGSSGQFVAYSPAAHKKLAEDLHLEHTLRLAVESSSLEVVYQARQSMRTNRFCGVEALVRWNLNGTAISPARFIPIAERNGLIGAIGKFVFEKSLIDLKPHVLKGSALAVNLSANQLLDATLPSFFLSTTRNAGLEPESIELELTESALMEHFDRALAFLEEVRSLGFHVAIDDFGTGYSSLGYLSRLPVTRLKIDCSFVCSEHPNDWKTTRSIVQIAKEMGLKITAEGVETEEQLQRVAALDIDEIQGYLFARPVSAGDLLLH